METSSTGRKGWGPFLVKVGNNIDRQSAKRLATYFEFESAELGKLCDSSHPGDEIVNIMRSMNLIQPTDISPLLEALNDIERKEDAQKIKELYDIKMRDSRSSQEVPLQGNGGESCRNISTGGIAEYSLKQFLDLRPSENIKLRNIVVVGKTGVGKSTTVNTILGRSAAKAGYDPHSMTKWSSSSTCEYYNNTIVVADTPGFVDKPQDNKKVMQQLARLAFLMPDGIHCFIICMSAADPRLTDSKKQMLEKLQDNTNPWAHLIRQETIRSSPFRRVVMTSDTKLDLLQVIFQGDVVLTTSTTAFAID